jgi:predicted TIM-barrel fold metal-dependent hydrolase
VTEIERTAAKGARAIGFPENPASPQLNLPSWYTPHWDPVFSAAQTAEMPLCMHVGTSGALPSTSKDMPIQVGFVLMACNSMATVTDLIYSGAFARFPGLKVTLPEGGIGWIPSLMERLDGFWETHRTYEPRIDHGIRPSEMFKDHIYPCFIDDDDSGLELRHRIGVDQILWESDYPHSDSNWPHSRKVAAAHLENVPDDEARKIVGLNARRLFKWER